MQKQYKNTSRKHEKKKDLRFSVAKIDREIFTKMKKIYIATHFIKNMSNCKKNQMLLGWLGYICQASAK